MNAISRHPVEPLENHANVKLWQAALARLILDEQRKYQSAVRGEQWANLDSSRRVPAGTPDSVVANLKRYLRSRDGKSLMELAGRTGGEEKIVEFVTSSRKVRSEVAADNLTLHRKNGKLSK